MLEIIPPSVKLQDFGSLNGTYLDGELIGRRDRLQSPEEAQAAEHGVFTLRDGSVLGLGKSCEFVVHIESAEVCACCGAVLPAAGASALPADESGKRICARCYAARLRGKKQAEAAALRVCRSCGKSFQPTGADNYLCPDCLADRGKIIDGVLDALRDKLPHGRHAPGEAGEPSILEGFDQIRRLGAGGYGEVWRVRRRSDGKDFALKTMLSAVAADEENKRAFLREAGISRQLSHPNIVQVLDVGTANGTLYILMELCDGGSVDKLMDDAGGRLPPEQATRIILQCLSALEYIHNAEIVTTMADGTEKTVRGLVHRDFKPGNIFMTAGSGSPVFKVADYGLSKAFELAGMSGFTETGEAVGTKAYMSRAQAINYKYAKPDVDVWSAAASYFHMLTGTTPKNFSGGQHPISVIVSGKARPVQEFNPNIPDAMARVIDRALIDDPKIGYSTAAEFRAELISALPREIREYCRDSI